MVGCGLRLASASNEATPIVLRGKRTNHQREGGMLDGITILAVGFCFYAAIWFAVIYGASFFGPK
jgi:hypothetical protein